jgi:hypothetical protein
MSFKTDAPLSISSKEIVPANTLFAKEFIKD